MAEITIPGVLQSFRAQLLPRAALAGVPVYLVDRRSWQAPEAIVLGRVVMTGARWLGWGAGPASRATVESLSLQGYVFSAVAGSDPTNDAAALDRAGVLFGEVVQQLRDDPTVGGDLAGSVRYEAPKVDSSAWDVWPSEQDGSAIIRIRVDFRVVWQAVS
jgi:hypothetical protein